MKTFLAALLLLAPLAAQAREIAQRPPPVAHDAERSTRGDKPADSAPGEDEDDEDDEED